MQKGYVSRSGACLRDGCNSKRWATGLCRSHYEKQNRQFWQRGISLKSNPVIIEPQENLDTEDLWDFVKNELKIQK